MDSETKAGTIRMIHEIYENQHARPEQMGMSDRHEKTTCFVTRQLAIVSFETKESTMILTQNGVEAVMDFVAAFEATKHFDLSVQTGRCLTLIHSNECLLEMIRNQSLTIQTCLFH